MSDQRKQILQMLADGKISTDEAEKLLKALEGAFVSESEAPPNGRSNGQKPKFLCIQVKEEPGGNSRHENVDIKIPIMLLKAGMKLGGLVPKSARSRFTSHLSDKGFDIDLNELDAEKLDILIAALTESSIDVDTDKEKVRIFCA